MSFILVDSIGSVIDMINDIEASPLDHPFLFIDIEGTRLSRHGKVAIIQVLVPPKRAVYLVDIETLQGDAFETPSASSSNLTFKNILESEEYPKVLFDVRNDSDALYSHFNIDLKCVIDVQLFEYATRWNRTRYVKGLAKCIAEDAMLSRSEKSEWQAVKEAGAKLFAPEKGGRYEVFHERPISSEIIRYCVQDVLILPDLLKRYAGRMDDCIAAQVHSATLARVRLSQSPHFNGKGKQMVIGPSLSSRYVVCYRSDCDIFADRHGRAVSEPLCFPMTLIRSPRLNRYCILAAAAETSPMVRLQQGPGTGSDGRVSKESSAPADALGPIAGAFAAMNIEGSSRG